MFCFVMSVFGSSPENQSSSATKWPDVAGRAERSFLLRRLSFQLNKRNSQLFFCECQKSVRNFKKKKFTFLFLIFLSGSVFSFFNFLGRNESD